MIGFGAGDVFLVPPGATPTPIRMGQLQEASLDISFETKKAYGGRQFPFAIARGKGTIKGKAKAGLFQPQLIGSILTGSTSAGATQRVLKLRESTGVISGGTYTVTTATGFSDLGVVDSTGTALTRVASAPAAGQYSVTTAGVYTFNTAANGTTLYINYSCTVTTPATSYTTSYANQLMGSGSTYQLTLFNTNPDGSTFGVLLYAVVFDKLSFGFKTEDFTMPDMDFEALADASDNVLQYYGSAQ